MRLKAAALLAALAALAPTSAVAQQSMSQMGMSMSAQVFEVMKKTSQIVATSNVHVEASNKISKTYFVADASRMVISGFTDPESKGALQGMEAVKSMEFFGPVKMLFTTPKLVKNGTTGKMTEVMTKMTACADNVTFNGVEGTAYLTGNVRITNDDPSMFAAPAVMTGEKASINLRKTDDGAGPDFKIESPGGVSTIEVAPNAKPEASKKK